MGYSLQQNCEAACVYSAEVRRNVSNEILANALFMHNILIYTTSYTFSLISFNIRRCFSEVKYLSGMELDDDVFNVPVVDVTSPQSICFPV